MPDEGYRDWIIKRCETPTQNCKSFKTESSSVIISVECDTDNFIIQFHGLPSLRRIDESYRNELWLKIPIAERIALGNTWMVENTDFLEFLTKDELFNHHMKKPKQYVMLFENEIIEVVSDVEPEIRNTTSSSLPENN